MSETGDVNKTTVGDTVRDFWATRPRRRTDDSKLGGVAAAIARRYALDPVLVRVAFVVAAFLSGAGILLYLLGWLLLPADGDEASAAESLLGRGSSSMSPLLTLLLGIALIPAVGIVFGGSPYGLVGLVASGGALLVLHRNRATLGELPPGGGQSAPPDSAPPDSPPPDSAPPDRDPLGAAPLAWNLADPDPVTSPEDLPPPEDTWSQPPTPPQGPRSKITPITLGLALLVGGIAAALWPALSAAHILALGLGVVGLGLVVGSLMRGGRGLIVVAVPLALLTWVLHAVPVSSGRVGEDVWTPITVAAVQPRYGLGMGSALLDLGGLRVPEGQTVRTALVVGAGEARVVLPPDIDAEVFCRASVGSVDCLDETSSDLPARVDQQSTVRDGPGGGALVLDVRTGVGSVQVVRGA